MKVAWGLAVAAVLFGMNAHASDEVKKRIEQSLGATGQAVRVTSVEAAPIKGLLNVELNGSEWLLASEDGRYLIAGELFELGERGLVSVTEQRLQNERQKVFADFDMAKTVTFKAPAEKAEVMVFTDPSCGYCRRLHEEIEQINAAGITVHYLAFPRSGVVSQTGELMVQVWCAKDSQTAMTESKRSGRITETPPVCENPVAEQYALGGRLGVRGTPAVFSMQGEQLGGYLAPAKLAEALGLE